MVLGRQLHKRRLMPAPRPFILDPLPDAPTLGRSSTEPISSDTSYDINGRRVRPVDEEKEEQKRTSIAAALQEMITGGQPQQSGIDGEEAGEGAQRSLEEVRQRPG